MFGTICIHCLSTLLQADNAVDARKAVSLQNELIQAHHKLQTGPTTGGAGSREVSTCTGPDWSLGSRARVCSPRARLEQQVHEARNAVTERTQENEGLQEWLRSAQVPAMCLGNIITVYYNTVTMLPGMGFQRS